MHRQRTYSHQNLRQVVGTEVPVALEPGRGVRAAAPRAGGRQDGNRGIAAAYPATVFPGSCGAHVAVHLAAGSASRQRAGAPAQLTLLAVTVAAVGVY